MKLLFALCTLKIGNINLISIEKYAHFAIGSYKTNKHISHLSSSISFKYFWMRSSTPPSTSPLKQNRGRIAY